MGGSAFYRELPARANPAWRVLLSRARVGGLRPHGKRDLCTRRRAGPLELAAERALEGANRVNAIVKGLRTFSRPDDRTIARVDPRELLASALRMVGNDIHHRAELVEDFRKVPEVMGNAAQLSQVFLNLRHALRSHDVTVVGSAREGLEAVQAKIFDVIFCDIMMPGMTGIDFYERLERIDSVQFGYIVFITEVF